MHVIALYRMVLPGFVLLASARGLYLARHLPTLYGYRHQHHHKAASCWWHISLHAHSHHHHHHYCHRRNCRDHCHPRHHHSNHKWWWICIFIKKMFWLRWETSTSYNLGIKYRPDIRCTSCMCFSGISLLLFCMDKVYIQCFLPRASTSCALLMFSCWNFCNHTFCTPDFFLHDPCICGKQRHLHCRFENHISYNHISKQNEYQSFKSRRLLFKDWIILSKQTKRKLYY